MEVADLLVDGFERVRDTVHAVVGGLSPEQLVARLDPEANTVAWLVWHLTRVQDDHVAGVAGTEQAYTAEGWADRFGFPFPAGAIGFGHGPDEVAAVRVTDPALLVDYHDAVHKRTASFVRGLTAADLDRVVDEAWDPPVTLGVRLISVIDDDAQHVGQAALIRGVLERASD